MSFFSVYNFSHQKEWNYWFDRLPENFKDIHYSYDYNYLYELNGDGAMQLFVYGEGEHFYFYPFVLKAIKQNVFNEKYFDIETVYGYTGPLSNSINPDFLKKSRQVFNNWAEHKNVVSEFIRFNPLLDNIVFSRHDDSISIVPLRHYVYVDLRLNEDELWNKSYSSVNRNRIRKARKEGLQIIFDAELEYFEDFKKIYIENMRSHNAVSMYFFSQPFFDQLKLFLRLHGILIVVLKDGKPIAGATFFKGTDLSHYFLSSANEEGKKYPATNYILHEAINWSKAAGANKFHLGGGMTSDADDTLLRFKRRFSTLKEVFYIGKKIHNQKAYDLLVTMWNKQFPRQAEQYKNILQRYHLNEKDFRK
ncbi:MAG: hypothetical protein RIQ89_712 [Bacteroidota bacterium]|jgi:lipid II:glycine glycyltransferase (peptidoglycan interpeptide bridge formation enzyme)